MTKQAHGVTRIAWHEQKIGTVGGAGASPDVAAMQAHIHELSERLDALPEAVMCLENKVAEVLRRPGDDYKTTVVRLEQYMLEVTGESDLPPRQRANLIFAFVHVLSKSAFGDAFPVFREFVRHSWWLENYWIETAATISSFDETFKSNLIEAACLELRQHDAQCAQNHPLDNADLTRIWFHHFGYGLAAHVWQAVEILACLDKTVLIDCLVGFKSAWATQDALTSPLFHHRFDLWQAAVAQAPSAFDANAAWNNSPILPLLLEHGRSMVRYVVDVLERPARTDNDRVDPAQIAETLLQDVATVISSRKDFARIFKRWGCWLTRQIILFPPDETHNAQRVVSRDLLLQLAQQLEDKKSLKVRPTAAAAWEPWVYRSMLAILAIEWPSDGYPLPDVSTFTDEWTFSIAVGHGWFSDKGQQLASHASLFAAQQPGSYPARVLGYALAAACPEQAAAHWQAMWDGMFVVRQALESNTKPTAEYDDLSTAQSSRLCTLLMDIGLSILGFMEAQAKDGSGQAAMVAPTDTLFQALWTASWELIALITMPSTFSNPCSGI